ncbi:hypothetical protein [Butyrivibrio sp. AC2005]|uniref:hypothetical protein n=1 Tax=Butyrivibrio sp. AC2005 TaxID=1280672 RepID=UPI00040196C6|nr:hypothetical protein [Butyrivibrio sp. AC2005]
MVVKSNQDSTVMHGKLLIAVLLWVMVIGLMGCKPKKENLKIESGEDESDSWIIKDGPDGPSVGFVAKEVSADELASVEEEESIVNEYSLTGTWQTVSTGYEEEGSMQPEYYVQFSPDFSINYGHMENGKFMLDHTDMIDNISTAYDGQGCRIQAESVEGVHYTYQRSNDDDNMLEYYETWDEKEFADKYRGGASLKRANRKFRSVSDIILQFKKFLKRYI